MHDKQRRDSSTTSTPDMTIDPLGLSQDHGQKMCRSLPKLDEVAGVGTELADFPYTSEQSQYTSSETQYTNEEGPYATGSPFTSEHAHYTPPEHVYSTERVQFNTEPGPSGRYVLYCIVYCGQTLL